MSQDMFVRFLLTGSLDEVAIGWTDGAVQERFGPPPEVTRLRRGMSLWAYGGRVVQVTLQRNRVVLIGIYLQYASAVSADLLGGGVPLPPKTDRPMLTRQLEAWHVRFRDSHEWPGAYEVGDAGVHALFGEDEMLESFQVALRTRPGRLRR